MPAPPNAPPLPHPSLAVAAAHIWPSLHCLMPASHPSEIDTGEVFTGAAHNFACTLDITRGMKYGLLQVGNSIPRSEMDSGLASFADYVADTRNNVFSHCDGGQIMVNFVADGRAILWNAHLGAYEGVFKCLDPKPSVAILGIAGRANYNGRPFDGSAAQFAVMECQWLNEPESVIWCLHDESPIKPYRIDVTKATQDVESSIRSRVLTLKHAVPHNLSTYLEIYNT